jgi:hypothetical protein
VSVAADAAALAACEAEMRSSITAMRERLDDPDRNAATAARFPMLDDRAACRRCVFRRPCGRL